MKSLELNWIRNVDKSLVIPEVIYHYSDYSGQYLNPRKNEVYDMNGRPYNMHFGVIVLNPIFPAEFEATLAHEWRHHWQLFHGIKYDGIGYEKSSNDYEDGVVKYFTQSKAEMDAVKFEWKFCKKSFTPLWEELLYPYLKQN